MCRKGKVITRISIYSSEGKALSFPQKWSNVANLLPGGWLVILGNGAISGPQCWSLLLAYLALSSSCSQVSLGAWKSMLSPCTTPISAIMAAWLMGPLGNGRNGWGKRLTIQRMGLTTYLITEVTFW